MDRFSLRDLEIIRNALEFTGRLRNGTAGSDDCLELHKKIVKTIAEMTGHLKPKGDEFGVSVEAQKYISMKTSTELLYVKRLNAKCRDNA